MVVVALLQVFASFGQLVADQEKIFRGDTGVGWSDFEETYPTVAAHFSVANQGALVANIALGLFALAVIHFAFRKVQPWSWFALWILPLSMVPGVLNLVLSNTPAWIIAFGGGIILLAILGLVISIRSFFPGK